MYDNMGEVHASDYTGIDYPFADFGLFAKAKEFHSQKPTFSGRRQILKLDGVIALLGVGSFGGKKST